MTDRPAPGRVDPGAVALAGLAHAWPAERGETVVLDGLDLRIDAGSFVSLVGPSGCGKSTVLRILAGLLRPSAGTATIGGLDVVGRPGSAAWMPQRDDLLPWRRVLGNATLGAEAAGADLAAARAQALVLLDRFGLGGSERAWPSQLSGGMRQRLAVLRTFLVQAPVLLLDEPFGALDALTRRRMQAWLQEVWLDEAAARPDGTSAGRRTVVLVTHDVEEALLLADRVIVLSERPGRVVADIAVDAPRPRPPSMVSDPAFVADRARILDALGA